MTVGARGGPLEFGDGDADVDTGTPPVLADRAGSAVSDAAASGTVAAYRRLRDVPTAFLPPSAPVTFDEPL